MQGMPRCAAVLLLAAASLVPGATAATVTGGPPPPPPPPGWPAWSWDSMRSMLFYHSGNESGFYANASVSKMAEYSVVTMEKFNGQKWTKDRPAQYKYDEDMMVENLRRIDAAHPSGESTVLIFYMNAWKAKELEGKSSRMYEQFKAHPEWELFHDVGGGSCGTKKPGCAWDVSLPEVRRWWVETCVNATRAVRASGRNVGCYADASNTYPLDPEHEKTPNDAALLWPTLANTNAATKAKAKAWTEGLLNMTTQAQLALGRAGFIMGKTANQPGVGALQIEGFAASNSSINAMQDAVHRGKLVEGHIGMGGSSGGTSHPGCLLSSNPPGGEAAQAQMMEDHVAAFLIAAGPYCYIGCGQWNLQGESDIGEYGGGLEFIDNPWVDRRLGVKASLFWAPFSSYEKDYLPRQARDKHKESHFLQEQQPLLCSYRCAIKRWGVRHRNQGLASSLQLRHECQLRCRQQHWSYRVGRRPSSTTAVSFSAASPSTRTTATHTACTASARARCEEAEYHPPEHGRPGESSGRYARYAFLYGERCEARCDAAQLLHKHPDLLPLAGHHAERPVLSQPAHAKSHPRRLHAR